MSVLLHACVVTVVSLAEEIIGICMPYLAISGEELANYLDGLAYSSDECHEHVVLLGQAHPTMINHLTS